MDVQKIVFMLKTHRFQRSYLNNIPPGDFAVVNLVFPDVLHLADHHIMFTENTNYIST